MHGQKKSDYHEQKSGSKKQNKTDGYGRFKIIQHEMKSKIIIIAYK